MALPVPFAIDDFEPLDRTHWEALREGRLLIQRCRRCGRTFLPATLCSCSVEPEMEWIESAGAGTLHAWAVFHRAYAPHLREALPYTVCVVRLDEGPLVVSTLEVPPDHTPRVEERMRVAFRRPEDGLATHYFTPDGDAA